jgi:arylformamidase
MFIFLSHILSTSSPTYPGNLGLKISPQFSFQKGDPFNQCEFTMCNHIGTHLDLPRHFNPKGATVDQIKPAEWVFKYPIVVDIPKLDHQVIEGADLEPFAAELGGCDLLLIRTGFESHRDDHPRYSKANPSLGPSFAEFVLRRLPKLRAVGMDLISAGNTNRVEDAIAVHRLLLGYPDEHARYILIIEDMALKSCPKTLGRVVVLPLMLEGLDGVPCTILAEVV